MQTQIAHAQSTVNTTFAHRMIDVQAEIRRTIQAVLGRWEQELTEAIEAARKTLDEEAGRRAETRKRLEGNLGAVRTLRRQARDLLTELGADGDAIAPEPA
jgi:hypothetical protein